MHITQLKSPLKESSYSEFPSAEETLQCKERWEWVFRLVSSTPGMCTKMKFTNKALLPRQNPLFRKFASSAYYVLLTFPCNLSRRLPGLFGQLESFVQFTQEILRYIFFILVLRKTLRNISFRRMNKDRSQFRLGHFEQKPEVTPP